MASLGAVAVSFTHVVKAVPETQGCQVQGLGIGVVPKLLSSLWKGFIQLFR